MHTPKLHFDKKRHYFYCRIGGYHYLGKNAREARRKFADLLRSSPYVANPVSVAGLILAWQAKEGATSWQKHLCQIWAGQQGATMLHEVGPGSLRTLVDGMVSEGYAPWTIRHIHALATRVFAWGVKQGLLSVAPDPAKRLPRSPERFRDIPPDELSAVLANCGPNTLPLVSFILATGCRPGEARTLTWRNVRLDKSICVLVEHKTANKSGAPRTIYLTPDAARILQSMPRGEPDSPVFPSKTGKPFTRSGLHSALLRAGLSSVYRLRHTAAQSWLDAGVPLEDVAKLLGHNDPSMRSVRIYAKIRDSRAIKVALSIAPPVPLPPAAFDAAKREAKPRRRKQGAPNTRAASRRRSELVLAV